MPPEPLQPPQKRIVRISGAFSPLAPEIFRRLDLQPGHPLGKDYHLVETPGPEVPSSLLWSRFVRWSLPLHHSWPCHPRKMDHFIEKAAQTLARKFSGQPIQTLLVGSLDPADSYYKTLASNLRGRTLQLFPPLPASSGAEAQDPNLPTLFCLVGKEGLFCGIQTPRAANGFHPGGTRYIRQSASTTISRAGAKIAEALHYLRLHHTLPAHAHWLELGASPGGMTSELLAREQTVTAIDRAPLHPSLNQAPKLHFHRSDAASFRPAPGSSYDAILCDLNGSALHSIQHVIRLSSHLKPGGIVIFTLKTAGADHLDAILSLCQSVEKTALEAGFRLIAGTHLTYNRHEFTLFFSKAVPSTNPASTRKI